MLERLKDFMKQGKAPAAAAAAPDPTNMIPSMVSQPTPAMVADTTATPTFSGGDARAPDAVERAEHASAPAGLEQRARADNPKDEKLFEGLSDRFDVLERLGDGTFSNVHRARDVETGREVAVKIVRKFEMAKDASERLNPEFRRRNPVTDRANVLKEVQIMRSMDHPSIVRLISFSESDEHYYLVLELLNGGELFEQIVKLTYLSEQLARHVILQVAEGIRYMHEERGVVHRDIKPENLLFEALPIKPSPTPAPRHPYDEDKMDEGVFTPGIGGGGIGRVKIADFGLSKVVWEDNTKTPCGTVGYAAPEIVRDEIYSKSVDMWALGCVLYTLLCGFPPFYDESINVLTDKVARADYTFLSPWWDDISDSAKDLINHLLCVDPDDRYTIDEFLAHEWCRAGSDTPAAEPKQTSTIPQDDVKVEQRDSPLLASLSHHEQLTKDPLVSPHDSIRMRHAFDVTYAVHRTEEENRHRRNAQPRHSAIKRNAARTVAHVSLNPSDNLDSQVEKTRRRYGDKVANEVAERCIPYALNNDHSPQTSSSAFELNMNCAAILQRRQRDHAPGHSSVGVNKAQHQRKAGQVPMMATNSHV